MMNLLHLLKAMTKKNPNRKGAGDEPIYCTRERCQTARVVRGRVSQDIPARDRCFNISNCSL